MDANGAVTLDVSNVEHFPSDATRVSFKSGQGQRFFEVLRDLSDRVGNLSIAFSLVFRKSDHTQGFNLNFGKFIEGDFLHDDLTEFFKSLDPSLVSGPLSDDAIRAILAIQRNIATLTACVLANATRGDGIRTQQLLPTDRLTGVVYSSGLFSNSTLDMHVDLEKDPKGRESRIVFANIPPVVRNTHPDTNEVRTWSKADDIVPDRVIPTDPYDLLLFDRATTTHSMPAICRNAPLPKRDSLRLTFER